ncbi:MAG: hypothetical protein DRJ42_25910 [Deltaproteobacteria bacterium]|nr:MAG: hypothetical protein DRJ42_25910 [Deltaproteobacteria bacterium]
MARSNRDGPPACAALASVTLRGRIEDRASVDEHDEGARFEVSPPTSTDGDCPRAGTDDPEDP